MNLLRTYGIPLFLFIPTALGLGLLWFYLLPFATSDASMIFLFLFMCLFGIAASALVQFLISKFSRPREEGDEEGDDNVIDSSEGKTM